MCVAIYELSVLEVEGRYSSKKSGCSWRPIKKLGISADYVFCIGVAVNPDTTEDEEEDCVTEAEEITTRLEIHLEL